MELLRGLSSSPASAYDELVTGQKSIRYHWQGILSVIRALPGGLGERVESARRQLEELGATVNLLDDRGAPRWTFDPLPFVIVARRMVGARDRPHPARPPARRRPGRSLRPADAARRSACCRRCWSTPTGTSCGPARSSTARRRRAISPTTPSTWCGWAAGAGTCWPTTPRCRPASAMRWRCAACWRAACPRPSAPSRCAISGPSSTAGTIRCSPWRPAACATPTWPC